MIGTIINKVLLCLYVLIGLVIFITTRMYIIDKHEKKILTTITEVVPCVNSKYFDDFNIEGGKLNINFFYDPEVDYIFKYNESYKLSYEKTKELKKKLNIIEVNIIIN